MKKLFVIGMLMLWVFILQAQRAKSSFQQLLADFEEEYAELSIPYLTLSYVDNLKNVGSEEELNAQERFFQTYQKRLEKEFTEQLSEEDQITYQVLLYEIDLNLERIELEKKWLSGDVEIKGERIYDVQLGKEWYAYFLKKWIDKKLTPEATFQFGLEEIEKVKANMATIRSKIEANGKSFESQWEDPKYLLSSNEEVLEKYNILKEEVKQKAKRYFPNLSQTPKVNIAKGTNEAMAIAPAYYSNNTFYYNFFGDMYDIRDMGWVFMHEAFPGHHYQHHMAAQADEGVRDLFYYMGYTEGWGAYIEQFGKELGAYKTPFDEYAWLQWDLIRSTRVALDVGLNYYGWSDEKAMEFWKQHIPNQEAIGNREIKRMKRWPAQVITYKYGKYILDKLKGDKTTPEELKRFHQEVLEHGDLPLSVLQKHIQKKQQTKVVYER